MKILSIQKVSKKYFIVEYKHLKQYNRAMYTNLESIERFLSKNKIYNKQKAFCMLDNLKESYVLKKPTAMYEIKEQNLDFLIDNLNKEIKKIPP